MRTSYSSVVVLTLILAACGGGDDPAAPPTDPSVATTAKVSVATQAAETPATTEADMSPPIDLAGTSWNVIDYSQGSGLITNVWKTDVTVAFDDGTLSGSAGCNTYSATWSTTGTYDPHVRGEQDSNDGQAISFDELSWTEIACDDADVMEQEAEILALLQATGRWLVRADEGTLSLRDADGGFLLRAEPSS